MFKTIKAKVLFVYSLCTALFIIAIVGMIYMQERSKLLNLAINNSMEVSGLYSHIVGDVVEKNILLLTNIADQEAVKRLDMEHIIKELSRLKEMDEKLYDNTTFLDTEGYVTDTYGRKMKIKEGSYAENLKQKLELPDTDYIVSDPIMGGLSNTPIVILSVPIRSDEGVFRGALTIAVKLTTLSNEIRDVKIGGDSYGWICDQKGVIMAHPKEEFLLNVNINESEKIGYQGFDKIAKAMITQDNGFGKYLDTNANEKRVVTFSKIENTPGWKLGITTLEKDIFSDISLILSRVIMTSLAMLLLFIGIIFRLTKSVMLPINKLTSAVRMSMNRNFAPLNLKVSDDEIGQLVEAYNEMTHEISVYTNELEGLVADRTMELNELNGQLNEHNRKLSLANENLYNMATRDNLTGLFNRAELYRKLESVSDEVKNGVVSECSILFMDLDNFKHYNDTFGHDFGDKLLQYVSYIFRKNTRKDDFIARYGGDEFVTVFPELDIQKTMLISNKLSKDIEQMNLEGSEDFDWPDDSYLDIPPEKHLGLSIGICHFDRRSIRPVDDLLKEADSKMYKEKYSRKGLKLQKAE